MGIVNRKTFIISVIRGGFRKWTEKYECLKDARVGKQVNKTTGRMAEHYKCAACSYHFPLKEVQVDHINPVVDPVKGFVNWDEYIDRMYTTKDNLQCLCKPCHKEKTNAERKQRSGKRTPKQVD